MQKASKKFDERIETINKLKNPKRRKLHQSPHFGNNHMFELPVITNTLTSFHKEERAPVKYNNLYSHRSNQKVQTELDSIITGALMHYKNQKINKIIFASPINNRLTLGKTYYRASRFASLDEPSTHRSLEVQPRRRLREGLDLSSLRLDMGSNLAHLTIQPQEQPPEIVHNIPQPLPLKLPDQNHTLEADFGMFYTASEDVPPPPKKMRKTYVRPLHMKKTEKREARYSPWKNEEGEEELII